MKKLICLASHLHSAHSKFIFFLYIYFIKFYCSSLFYSIGIIILFCTYFFGLYFIFYCPIWLHLSKSFVFVYNLLITWNKDADPQLCVIQFIALFYASPSCELAADHHFIQAVLHLFFCLCVAAYHYDCMWQDRAGQVSLEQLLPNFLQRPNVYTVELSQWEKTIL